VKRAMHEYKRRQLKSGRGRRGKVKSRRQAIAIAMSESGQSYKRRSRKNSTRSARKTASRRPTNSRRKTVQTRSATRRKSAARRRRRPAR
jgi:hypothetical protein